MVQGAVRTTEVICESNDTDNTGATTCIANKPKTLHEHKENERACILIAKMSNTESSRRHYTNINYNEFRVTHNGVNN